MKGIHIPLLTALLGTALPAQTSRLKAESHTREVDAIRITPVVRAVKKAGPSVVNIQVGDLIQTREGPRFRKHGEGSGVIVSEEGLILTNWHVVHLRDRIRQFQVRVALRDGQVLQAKVLNESRENDLALLVIQHKDGTRSRFSPIEMGNSDTLMVGETVIAIGNPRGQANTVTTGVLSAVNRALNVTPRYESRPIVFKELLQVDAAINPGNSGGALLDITGKLIGINTLMQLESQNIGYAIPVNHVRQVFEQQLLNFAEVGVWTGLTLRDSKAEVVVAAVTQGGPGDRASIRRGDRILQVGKKKITTQRDFAKALITYNANQAVSLYVSTNGKAKWRRVHGWDRDDATVYQLSGMRLEPVDPYANRALTRTIAETLSRHYRHRGRFEMLRVAALQPDGPAAELGIKQEDIVLGFLEEFDRSDSYYPIEGGTKHLRQVLMQTRGRRSPLLSLWRSKEGLLRGRITVREK